MPEQAERKALEKGLNKLNENMATMAELSELTIRKAVDALLRGDPAIAEEVFTLDQELYGLQEEIEGTCVDLIALHAPVARDLRAITTSLKITTDLDRIGRYAKDIAEVSLQFPEGPPPGLADIVKIPQMTDHTIHMVETAIAAFLKRDPESVRNIMAVDDEVDRLHDEVFQEVVGHMETGRLPIAAGARYILVARHLERIADHAVNIGLRVVYMVTGETLPRIRAADRAKWHLA